MASAPGSDSGNMRGSTESSRPSSLAPATETVTSLPAGGGDDSSKLRAFLSILKKFVGVSDIAAVRFSLPAQLMEPMPNLEYWNYLDRPEAFVAIGDSDDPLGRMLAALRFWYTKDLKYIKGKPCKPYNSVLGEFFRCNWKVQETLPPVINKNGQKVEFTGEAASSNEVKVSYLTEQTSHHPPVSAFYLDCPEKSISARGYDQLSAKFTGTSIRVTPGSYNLGIFVNLHKRGEEYQMTHPAAYLGGLLRGQLSINVSDTCFITCPQTRLRAILYYMEESWLGKSQNRMQGVVYRYDPTNDKITRIKDAPEKDVVARLEGAWTDKIFYTLQGEKNPNLLIDLNPLFPSPKIVPPETDQLPNESLRFWSSVTKAIKSKQYGDANKLKQELEERQRARAAERKESSTEWSPRFFTAATDASGRPELTPDGKAAMEGLHRDQYALKESEVLGA